MCEYQIFYFDVLHNRKYIEFDSCISKWIQESDKEHTEFDAY